MNKYKKQIDFDEIYGLQKLVLTGTYIILILIQYLKRFWLNNYHRVRLTLKISIKDSKVIGFQDSGEGFKA
jgi:hypothetical protein